MTRLAITGMGFTLPGGVRTADDFWQRVRAGQSALTQHSAFHDRGVPTVMAGRLTHAPVVEGLDPKHASKYSREILAALASIDEALDDAGIGDVDPHRAGVIASSSRGPLQWWEREFASASGIGRVLGGLPGAPASIAAIRTGVQGYVSTVSSACVGGTHALRSAAAELRSDEADVMVVVGHEFPLTADLLRVYTDPKSRVLSLGTTAADSIRPYDADRDGTALGEGAVALVFEREADAVARGAHIYAFVLATGVANEAAHPTAMEQSGEKTAALAERVIKKSDLSVGDIGYVCGHGTGTRLNDVAESRAVRRVFGDDTDVPLTSVKPIFGHLFGASSLVNIAATASMLNAQTIAPTANSVQTDAECGLDSVFGGARRAELAAALSFAFALGSQSAVVALEAA
ncbi:beta-ketoacyl synthase N-terminal-like domain-containing protein [Streptomyces sp. NPDC005917]|uniref:beta-ketoacyl-[acyl-carrier-protein] synthase family protein n=1 Tax=unclassified Streptomyces TaxID=2593676 RepID=UPI0033C271CF